MSKPISNYPRQDSGHLIGLEGADLMYRGPGTSHGLQVAG